MIVHINASDIGTSLPYIEKAIDIVHDFGAVLAVDWAAATKQLQAEGEVNWKDHFNSQIEAIKRSDVFIVEASGEGFMQGYYIGLALRHKKPTLLVTRDHLATSPASGIKNRLLKPVSYENIADFEQIVTEFIRENTISTKDLRFNIFINREIYNFLQETSIESNKSKSEIIRDVLERKINQEDK